MNKFVDFASSVAPYIVVSVVFLVALSALISLVVVDVVTGQITGDYLSKDATFGLFTSLAGTGMLIGFGFLLKEFFDKENYFGFIVALIIFLALQGADAYFDAISVDIKRFGMIVSVATMSQPEAVAHNVYRIFVAGISLVGEPLGIASLVAFPFLKNFLGKTFKAKEFQPASPVAKHKPSTPFRPSPGHSEYQSFRPAMSSLPKKGAQNGNPKRNPDSPDRNPFIGFDG